MDTKTLAIVNELATQRSRYADACAELSGEIAVLREENAALKKTLADLNAAP